jgi:tripartite-type tricarboxylate transporter receptor subunit TctC
MRSARAAQARPGHARDHHNKETTMPDFAHSRLRRRSLLLAGLAALASRGASASGYPTKPITLILPFPPGGQSDVQMRILAQVASKELGQPIVVLNRPGAGGTLGPALMAQTAQPDGYTIALVVATLFRQPALTKVNFDPAKDFTYLINLTGFATGIVVKQDAPWKTLQDLLADAKARPGAISFGSTGIGSGGHIAMARLLRDTGLQMTFVPFKGGAETTAALLGGHLDVISDPGWGPMVQAGKARVLASMSQARLQRFPQVPTLKELGYDLVVDSPIGLAGPKGIAPAVVQRLHDAFRRAMGNADFARSLELNDQMPVYMGHEEYSRYAVAQTAREKSFIRELGITLD